MDRNTMKVQALLERISNLTTQYENQVADLRVEVTVVSNELQEVTAELERLRSEAEDTEEGVDEVPEEETPADE